MQDTEEAEGNMEREAAEEAKKLRWDEEAWAAADSRRNRTHAVALLASAAADAAAPLLTSSDLWVRNSSSFYRFVILYMYRIGDQCCAVPVLLC